MAQVRFRLPRTLAPFTGDQRLFTVEAGSLAQALDAAERRYPLLRTHLREESGTFRPHVVLFYNEVDLRQLASLDLPVQDGDEVMVLQAISGGRSPAAKGS